MAINHTGVKFSDISNKTLALNTIALVLLFVLILYFGQTILLILPITIFLMQVMFPLVLKTRYIIKFDNTTLYFRKSPWASPEAIEFDDIEKIEPETLIDEIYKLNIILNSKTWFVFETTYRDRLKRVFAFIEQIRSDH